MKCRQVQFVLSTGKHLVGDIEHDLAVSGTSERKQYFECPISRFCIYPVLLDLVAGFKAEFDERNQRSRHKGRD